MRTFDIDEVVEKTDAVVIDEQVEFLFAGGASREKDLDVGLDGFDLVLEAKDFRFEAVDPLCELFGHVSIIGEMRPSRK